MSNSARIIVEVVAGLIPEDQDPEFSKRWVIASEEWDDISIEKRLELLAEFNGKATGYTSFLMLQPDRLNWVRTDWIYL